MKFEEFVKELHIDYFYQGNYPKDYEKEFKDLYRKVEQCIKQLEADLMEEAKI
jgi:glutaredoxin 2